MCLSIPATSYGTTDAISPFKFTDHLEQSNAAITVKTILFLTSKLLEGISQGSAGKQQFLLIFGLLQIAVCRLPRELGASANSVY